MKINDNDIVLQLRTGDNHAYKYIYDKYYTLLCSIAHEYVKDDFSATTIVDDLIFHLWEKRESLDIRTSLRGYLIRSVINRCINYLNLEKEKREISFSSMNSRQEEAVLRYESFEYPSAGLLELELEEKISQAIEHLPEECREVFKMSRMDDKKYEEIASELNVSVNTVKYHMKNALLKLRNELSKYLIVLVFICFFNK
jgi:RNA polymerase sigma-70 factor (ECF subfamily)